MSATVIQRATYMAFATIEDERRIRVSNESQERIIQTVHLPRVNGRQAWKNGPAFYEHLPLLGTIECYMRSCSFILVRNNFWDWSIFGNGHGRSKVSLSKPNFTPWHLLLVRIFLMREVLAFDLTLRQPPKPFSLTRPVGKHMFYPPNYALVPKVRSSGLFN